MATNSSTLAARFPGTEDLSGLVDYGVWDSKESDMTG